MSLVDRVDRRALLRIAGGSVLAVAADNALNHPLTRAAEAFAQVETNRPFDAKNRLTIKYARNPDTSYKADITGTKIAVWNTTREDVRYIYEVVSDQVLESGKKGKDYNNNTQVVAIQRRHQNPDGSYRWENERVDRQPNVIIEGYTTGTQPCDEDGRPCEPTLSNRQRTVTVTQLAFQVVDDNFAPYAGSNINVRTFQAPSGDVCDVWWAGYDRQVAPTATATQITEITPTATIQPMPTSTPGSGYRQIP